METGIRDFCNAVIKKIKNDKDIKENKKEWQHDYRDRISFGICIIEKAPGLRVLGFNGYYPELMLDQEDIDYLYNKYLQLVYSEALYFLL